MLLLKTCHTFVHFLYYWSSCFSPKDESNILRRGVWRMRMRRMRKVLECRGSRYDVSQIYDVNINMCGRNISDNFVMRAEHMSRVNKEFWKQELKASCCILKLNLIWLIYKWMWSSCTYSVPMGRCLFTAQKGDADEWFYTALNSSRFSYHNIILVDILSAAIANRLHWTCKHREIIINGISSLILEHFSHQFVWPIVSTLSLIFAVLRMGPLLNLIPSKPTIVPGMSRGQGTVGQWEGACM